MPMRHISRIFACLTLVALTLAGTVAAQPPLADRVPSDALIYVGWRGVDKLGDDYNQSNLKAVLDASRFNVLVMQAIPDLIEQYTSRDQDAQLAAQFLQSIVPVLWHRPWTFYQRVLVPDQPEAGPPFRAQGTLLIDAGPDAATVTQWINQLIQAYQGPPAMKPQLINHDGLIGVRVNVGITPAPAADHAKTLADRDNFKAALKQVGESTALVAWADVARLTKTIDRGAHQAANPQRLQTWRRIRDALGLDQVKQAIYAAGFDDKDWRTNAFVALTPGESASADGPARTSLLALLMGGSDKHLTDKALELAPEDATWMSVCYLDPDALVNGLAAFAQFAFPHHPPSLDAIFAQIQARTGVDIERDLIRNLGNVWSAYNDPDAAGPAGMGMVLVNPVTNADAVRSALDKLAAWGQKNLNQDMHAPFPMFHFRTFTRDGVTLHTLSFLFLTPSWTVHDGKLYAALLPQAIVTGTGASTPVSERGGSILDNDRFKDVRDRLDVDDFGSIAFIDLPRTAPATYSGYVMLSQMVSGFMPGANVPGMILPPLGVVMAHLSPAGEVTWTDDAGWHYRSVSPFPGSSILGQQSPFTSMAAAPLAIGILMPALGAARRTARGMESLSNMRQITLGLTMYATDHHGRWPDSLPQILPYMGDQVQVFVHLNADTGPLPPPNASQHQKAAWIKANTSYVYIKPAAKMNQVKRAAGTIIVFEKPRFAQPVGLAAAYVDGHVSRQPIQSIQTQLLIQTGKTMKQLVAEAGEPTADKIRENGEHGAKKSAPPPPF